MKKIQLGFGFWLILISFILAGLIIWGVVVSQNVKEEKVINQTSREVALTCTTDMATQFHIHPQIKIVLFGEDQIFPSDIGIKPGCMNSIHTHSSDGIVHVEAPVKKDFTLGDFFAVWGKSFSTEKILDSEISSENIITITVNGEEVNSLDQTILNDNDQIIVEVK